MTFWDPFGSVYFSNNINAPFSFLGGSVFRFVNFYKYRQVTVTMKTVTMAKRLRM